MTSEIEDSDDGSFKIIDNRKLKRILGYEFRHPDSMAIRFEENSTKGDGGIKK